MEERHRLARDLHDTIKQSLFSGALITEVLPVLLERDPDQVRTSLRDLHLLLREAQAELNLLMVELRPKIIEDTDLAQLLRQLAGILANHQGIAIELVLEERLTLPADVKMQFYRIGQEALNNIAKHANPGKVIIRLHRKNNTIELHIHDDGCGFDLDRIPQGKQGLMGMRERASLIGARVDISSARKQGTIVTLTWRDTKLGRQVND